MVDGVIAIHQELSLHLYVGFLRFWGYLSDLLKLIGALSSQ